MNIAEMLESTGLEIGVLFKSGTLLVLGTLCLGLVGRMLFGHRSTLNHAVSSAIGILFLYAATVAIFSAGAEYREFLAPLPFVTITETEMTLFSFPGAEFSVICAQILSMIILAFLVNLIDTFLPEGENLFTWLFFRCLTVLLSMGGHFLVTYLFSTYLPEAIVLHAPAILLVLLVVLLAVGALKLLVGAALATVNPVIGALYTFFFANVVGRQLSKSVLTTALLSLLVYGLTEIGFAAISIASAALVAYVPFLLILLAVWYVVGRVL